MNWKDNLKILINDWVLRLVKFGEVRARITKVGLVQLT